MEKIVESIEDAMLMILAHPVSASGQLPTTYVTWMHGRSPLGECEDIPRESHIIILDNGRSAMRDDLDMRESQDARLLAENTHELFEYLIKVENETGKTSSSDILKGKRFGFHCACHQRPMGSGSGAIDWLRSYGAEVELIETGTCCGMGGTFGLKAGPLGHDLSSAMGEQLFTLFKNADIEAIVTESSVCSIQLAKGTDIPVYHPLEFLSLYPKTI